MCCGFAFWKRLAAFGFTFSIGVLVASFFTFDTFATKACSAAKKELPAPAQNFENKISPEAKKCVPVDNYLKYERLAAEEQSKSELHKTADRKKALKEAKEKQKNSFQPQKPLFDASKDSAEIKDALHR